MNSQAKSHTARNVAILTLPLESNYGGVLQAYALQRVLRQMGHCATTDLHLEPSHGVMAQLRNPLYFYPKRILRALRGDWQSGWQMPSKPQPSPRARKIGEFVAEHLSTMELFTRSYRARKSLVQQFDSFVVGSDQTWRPCYSYFTDIYYLSFLGRESHAKRVAYGASFGVDTCEYSPRLRSKCAPWLQLFDAVSVRERSGVRLCRELFDVEAQQVLDPTLLLEAEDYLNLAAKEESRESNVWSYMLDVDSDKSLIASSIAQRLGVPLTAADSAEPQSVEQWLAAFRDSDFVVTDSFHGTVFSIVMHRPFVTIVNKQRGASRFESLLGALGLESRMVESVEGALEVAAQRIDFDAVDVRLEVLRRESLEFLNNALR